MPAKKVEEKLPRGKKPAVPPQAIDPDDCFHRLEGFGWFAGWPASAIQSAKKTLAGNIFDEGFRSICAAHPGMAMASIWGDSECINDDESYSALIRLFARGSHGLFRPKNIQESWPEPDDREGLIELACEVGKTRYSMEIEQTGTDYLNWDFLRLINSALAARKAPLQFVVPADSGGQDFLALLIPVGLPENLTTAGVLPKVSIFEPEVLTEEQRISKLAREASKLAARSSAADGGALIAEDGAGAGPLRIRWRGKINKPIWSATVCDDGAAVIFVHSSLNGFTVYDVLEKKIRFEFKHGSLCSRSVYDCGKWLLCKIGSKWISLDVKDGQLTHLKGLKEAYKRFHCGKWSVFASGYGAAVVDLELGAVTQYPKGLSPYGSTKGNTFLSDPSVSRGHWIGSLIVETGKLEPEVLLPLPLGGNDRFLDSSDEGLLMAKNFDTEPQLFMFSWQGEPLAAPDLSGFSLGPGTLRGAQFIRRLDGSLSLLLKFFRDDKYHLTCVDLRERGRVLWQQEFDGHIPWTFDICNQCSFWTTSTQRYSDNGFHHAWMIYLETGEIQKFSDKPIAHWVGCSDHGLYFCDMERGRKEFVFAEIV